MNKLTEYAAGMANRVIFVGKKKSPEILIGLGIITGIAAAVKACKETPKALEVLENHKKTMDKIHEAQTTIDESEYSHRDLQIDTAKTYFKTTVDLARVYAWPIALGVTSVGCTLAGSHIIKVRYAGMSAAYSILKNDFDDYRGRVEERYGKEAENDIRLGVKKSEIVETIETEDGKRKKTKKTVDVADGKNTALVRYIKKGNPWWDDNEEFAVTKMRAHLNYLDVIRKVNGAIPFVKVLSAFDLDSEFGEELVLGFKCDKKDKDNPRTTVSADIKRVWITDNNGDLEMAYALTFENLVDLYHV